MALALFLPWTAIAVLGQTGAKNGEWRTYGGDLGNTHYSPLDQINASNFSKLQIAWRFKTENLGPRPEYNFEGTPLMVKRRGVRDRGNAPGRGRARCGHGRIAVGSRRT